MAVVLSNLKMEITEVFFQGQLNYTEDFLMLSNDNYKRQRGMRSHVSINNLRLVMDKESSVACLHFVLKYIAPHTLLVDIQLWDVIERQDVQSHHRINNFHLNSLVNIPREAFADGFLRYSHYCANRPVFLSNDVEPFRTSQYVIIC